MIVKVDDVLLKAEGQPEHRTRRRLALCVLMTLISIAVPIAAAVLYAHGSAGRTLNGSHFLGYNVVNLASGNFSDPGYAANTAAVGGTVLRYPGGNLADWWDWRTGWCVSATVAAGCPQLCG